MERHYTPMERERIVRVLTQHGIPVPPGELVSFSFNMGRGDWYVRTDSIWLWWSGKEWKKCPYGPL